jgi:hypothetical protein
LGSSRAIPKSPTSALATATSADDITFSSFRSRWMTAGNDS